MTKTRLFSIGVMFFLWVPGFAGAETTGANTLLGRYWLPDHDGQFEIYQKDGRYFGRVVSYDEPEQLDENNAEPALRTRPFIGIDMFAGFRFDASDERWIDGTIYDAKGGKTYDCILWFEEDKPLVLQARGYIGFSFLGRTETFDRVAETQ